MEAWHSIITSLSSCCIFTAFPSFKLIEALQEPAIGDRLYPYTEITAWCPFCGRAVLFQTVKHRCCFLSRYCERVQALSVRPCWWFVHSMQALCFLTSRKPYWTSWPKTGTCSTKRLTSADTLRPSSLACSVLTSPAASDWWDLEGIEAMDQSGLDTNSYIFLLFFLIPETLLECGQQEHSSTFWCTESDSLWQQELPMIINN